MTTSLFFILSIGTVGVLAVVITLAAGIEIERRKYNRRQHPRLQESERRTKQ